MTETGISLSWRIFLGPVKAVWRFYFRHRNVRKSELNAASRKAFDACDTALARLPPSERDIIRNYFETDPNGRDGLIAWYRQRGLSADYVNEVINRACRTVALEMGVADE